MSDIERIKKALDVPKLGDRHYTVVEKLRGGKVRCSSPGVNDLNVSGEYAVGAELLINVGGDHVRPVGASQGEFEG